MSSFRFLCFSNLHYFTLIRFTDIIILYLQSQNIQIISLHLSLYHSTSLSLFLSLSLPPPTLSLSFPPSLSRLSVSLSHSVIYLSTSNCLSVCLSVYHIIFFSLQAYETLPDFQTSFFFSNIKGCHGEPLEFCFFRK